MTNFKKITKIALAICFALVVFVYLAFVFVVLKFINNKKVQDNILNHIKQKTGYSYKIEDLSYKTSLNLKSTLKIKNLSNEFLEVQNLNVELFILKPLSVDADYVLFDYRKFNPKAKKKNKKKSSKLPKISIKRSDLIINDYLRLKFDNISYFDNKINFKTYIRKSVVNVEGFYFSALKYNIKLISKDILIKDIRDIFANTMEKLKPDEKNFIQNFEGFKGLADIDLVFEPKKINGTATLKDFETRFIKFPVPMHFKNAIFYFKDNNIDLKEMGLFDKYPLKTEFWARNLFTDDKYTAGFLETVTYDDIYKKHVKGASVTGKIKLRVDYFVKDKKPKVKYRADIFKNTIVSYKNCVVGLEKFKRKVEAQTTKIENDMFLNSYSYSYLKEKGYVDILFGDGKFSKKFPKDKFKLAYINVETKHDAPISLFGFLSKYLNGGTCSAKFKYDGVLNKVIGYFYLKNSRYKDFYIQNGKVDLNSIDGIIEAKGTYVNEPYSAYLEIINDLENVTINKIDLYLKKYEIKKENKKSHQKRAYRKSKINKNKINIKQANLRLDELKFKNIVLNNLFLNGYIKNSIAYFGMNDISFAKGILTANGKYNIQNHSSNITFSAKDIDANESASVVFNLKDNFAGLAHAKMNVRTYNKLTLVEADASFTITDGALTKLASSDFIIKNYRKGKNHIKFKIQDIINVDIKKMEALKSNINGHFSLKNEQIHNVEIFNQNKFLSLYLMGNYNIKSQNAAICLFAKYSANSQKGIKVLFIPLSWITKIIFKNENTKGYYKNCIDKIPPIQTDASDTETVLVKIIGNLNNSNSLHVDLKSLR